MEGDSPPPSGDVITPASGARPLGYWKSINYQINLNWSVIMLFGSISVRYCGDAHGQPLPAHLPPVSRRTSNGSSLGIWIQHDWILLYGCILKFQLLKLEYGMIPYSIFNHWTIEIWVWSGDDPDGDGLPAAATGAAAEAWSSASLDRSINSAQRLFISNNPTNTIIFISCSLWSFDSCLRSSIPPETLSFRCWASA